MSRLPLTAVLLFCITPLTGQSYVSSPKGFLSTEGAWHTWRFGAYPDGRHMVLDGELRGQQRTLKEIAHRLDYRIYGEDAPGRTWRSVTIDLAQCDASAASATFTRNQASTPTRVFQGSVTWESFTGIPPRVPSRWGGPKGTLRFPFRSGWVHTGKQDFSVDFDFQGGRLRNGSAWSHLASVGYELDSYTTGTRATAWQITHGDAGTKGCQDPQAAPGHAGWATLRWNAFGLGTSNPRYRGMHSIVANTYYTASNSSAMYVFGLRGDRKGWAFPGVTCNRVHIDLTGPSWFVPVAIPLGGRGYVFVDALPHARTVPGVEVWFQAAWSNSKTGALQFTNAASTVVPKLPMPYKRYTVLQPDPSKRNTGGLPDRYQPPAYSPVVRYVH